MSFKLTASYVFLTYKTHLEKEEYYQWLDNLNKVDSICIAHETGKEGDYKHTHVIVKFQKRIQKSSPRCFDYNEIHPNIVMVKGHKEFGDKWKYCNKEDKEPFIIEGTRGKGIIDKIWEYDSSENCLKDMINEDTGLGLNMVPHILTVRKLKPRIVIKTNLIHQWQKDLVSELEEEGNPRQVIWIVDLIGNTGKSRLGRYLMQTSKDWYMTASSSSNRDMATIVSNALDSGWSGKGFIIDLPRTCENWKCTYETIENIKNGLITATKYSGKTEIFDNEKLLVFSNFWPDVSKLSMDRWDIRELRELTLKKVPAKEVKDLKDIENM